MNDSIFARLEENLSNFEARPSQKDMTADVFMSFHEEQIVLIEAGTGTGKSLAYLLPALMWAVDKGEPVVIATHTIALQEQLMEKDIPSLLQIFDINLKVALVKGMSNYVCLRKFHDNTSELPDFLTEWLSKTADGTRSSLPFQISTATWDQIEAEAESCSHVKCPFFKECYFFKARKEAAESQILVTNHHLLFADLAARHEENNFSQAAILPPYKRIILDEAHHIEDVATEYFAERVNQNTILRLLNKLIADKGNGKLQLLASRILKLYPGLDRRREVTELLDCLELELPFEKKRLKEQISNAFILFREFVLKGSAEEKLRIQVDQLEDPFWQNEIQPSIEQVAAAGTSWLHAVYALEQKILSLKNVYLEKETESLFVDIRGICSRLEKAVNLLSRFVFSEAVKNRVRWIELDESDVQLIIAELEIAPMLSETLFNRFLTVVLCSATLATNRKFKFIRKRLGIPDRAVERIYESPFNFETQALLSIPSNLPDPFHSTFVTDASEKIWDVVKISKGGTFVLFTSYAMLQACETLLKDRFAAHHLFLLCQGQGDRTLLLEKFRASQSAILFGTDSFWEGIDVPLRCVIIVKLPFKVPSDPLFQARSEAISEKGGSPFFDFALPQAMMKFKQGFGRLIRNKSNRGCVVCLDPRLFKKGYGKQFIKNLPPCPHHIDSDDEWRARLNEFFAASKNT